VIGFLQGREIPSRATSPTNYWTQKPRWPRTIISLISSLRRTLCAVHDSRCLEMRFTTAVVRKARKQVSRDGSERRTVDRPVVWVLPFRIRIPIELTLPLPRSRNRALWFDPVSDVTSRSLSWQVESGTETRMTLLNIFFFPVLCLSRFPYLS